MSNVLEKKCGEFHEPLAEILSRVGAEMQDVAVLIERLEPMLECEKVASSVDAMEHMKLLQGIDALSCYQFNTRTAKQYFCQYCGIYTHHIPRSLPAKIGVNVACLPGVDISAFDVKQVSGAQLS